MNPVQQGLMSDKASRLLTTMGALAHEISSLFSVKREREKRESERERKRKEREKERAREKRRGKLNKR